MTVTIEVDGGPTVCLRYRGGWKRGLFTPYTSIEVPGQPTPLPPRWLYSLLFDGWMVLITYAVEEKHWPADLRPARQEERPDG